jgi:hypothetical protein
MKTALTAGGRTARTTTTRRSSRRPSRAARLSRTLTVAHSAARPPSTHGASAIRGGGDGLAQALTASAAMAMGIQMAAWRRADSGTPGVRSRTRA